MTAFETAALALNPELAVLLQEADPGTPANTLNDQMTGADGTALASHAADSGDSWVKHTVFGGGAQGAVITSNRLRATGSQCVHYSSDVPASADYQVTARIRCVTNTGTAGILARCSTVAATGYRLFYLGGFNTWYLFRDTGGSSVQLGSWTDTGFATPGTERDVILKVEHNAVSVLVDGVLRIEVADTAGAYLSAVGRAGVEVNGSSASTGFHIDFVQSRPLKSALLVDASGNGHDGTLVGEFTLGNDGFAAGEGSVDVLRRPEKGAWARFPGFRPFVPGSVRTFLGFSYHDPSISSGVPVWMGGLGLPGDANPNLPVLEAVYESSDFGFTRVHYNSSVQTMGVFGSSLWFHVLPIGEWFMWALTVNDNGSTQTLELFINGESQGGGTTTQVAWHANAGDYLLGQRGEGGERVAGGHSIQGSHGAQFVYESILTAAEIANLADIAGLLPDDSGVDATVFDYEAPNGDAARYRARSGAFIGGDNVLSVVSSPWVYSPNVTWQSEDYWLKHPTRPELNLKIKLRSPAEGGVTRSARQSIQQAVGSDTAIAITDAPAAATGTMVVRSDDDTAKAALEALVDTGDVLLFQPVGHIDGERDRWIQVGDWTRERIVDGAPFPKVWDKLAWTEVEKPE